MNRRTIILGCFATLAGCAQNADGTPDVGQVIDDAQTIITSLTRALPALGALVPPAQLADIQKYLALAQTLATTLSTTLSNAANAATLVKIEDAVNSLLAIVAGIPGVPPEIGLVAILLPVLEVFINSALPQQARALKVTAKPAVPAPMTPAQARAALKKGK